MLIYKPIHSGRSRCKILHWDSCPSARGMIPIYKSNIFLVVKVIIIVHEDTFIRDLHQPFFFVILELVMAMQQTLNLGTL